MSPTIAADLLSRHPMQAAYAVAVAALETAHATAAAEKLALVATLDRLAERDEVEAELEEMRIEAAAGIPAATEAVAVASKALIAWGIGKACDFSHMGAADLRELQAKTDKLIVLRRKVAETCMRLPAE